MKRHLVKKVINWSLFALTVVYCLTGLGITQYRIVEALTLGILSKNLSFRLHENLLVPFLVLIGLHIFFRAISRFYLMMKKKLRYAD